MSHGSQHGTGEALAAVRREEDRRIDGERTTAQERAGMQRTDRQQRLVRQMAFAGGRAG
ncbi:MAG: hypothetical protein MUE51_07590 [Thermoleophilia bacterium]|nr:hypothetical protein [Thermoleophilia bacterium]